LSSAANGRLSAALALVKLAMALALGAGTLALAGGDWSNVTAASPELACGGAVATGAAGFGAAVVGALWAYNGWYSLTLLAGEVRDPGRTIPRALIGGMGAVLAVSMLLGAATLYALAPAQVASVPPGTSAAVEAARGFLGPTGVSVVLAGLLASAFGALQVALMGNARVGYAMASDGLFFESSAKLSPRTRVPVSALLAQAQWTSVLVVTSSMDTLTDTLIFSSWMFYGLAAAGLIVLRRRRPDLGRPYRVWGYPRVPAAFVCAAVAIVVNTLLLSTARSLLGLGLIALGAPAYWYWSRRGGKSGIESPTSGLSP
jgi:basic amino acid/polyamine antiporter, APA family